MNAPDSGWPAGVSRMCPSVQKVLVGVGVVSRLCHCRREKNRTSAKEINKLLT